jgi:cytidyltransferase-like protein
MSHKSVFWFGILIALQGSWLESARAVPLTPESLSKVKKVAFFAGTFDPITKGHLGLAESALAEGGMDAVIILPNIHPSHKTPLAIEDRLKLLDLVAGANPRILYPKDGPLLDVYLDHDISPALMSELRKLNPKIEPYALVGQDLAEKFSAVMIIGRMLSPRGWLIGPREREAQMKVSPLIPPDKAVVLWTAPTDISSTQARKFFIENPEVYFAGDRSSEKLPTQYLEPSVIDYILDNGLYIGAQAGEEVRRSGMKNRIKRHLTTSLKKAIRELGLWEMVRAAKIDRVKNEEPREVVIDGARYRTKRYLASGLRSDAFLIDINGQAGVIKFQHKRNNFNPQASTIAIQRWLHERTDIAVPALIAFDPEGMWTVSEFIKGVTLKDYLRDRPAPSPAIHANLEAFFKHTMDFFRRTQVKLDLRADNIILKGETPYLVDLGALGPTAEMPTTFDEVSRMWRRQSSKGGMERASDCGLSLLHLFTGGTASAK